jgi:hypothetical protein
MRNKVKPNKCCICDKEFYEYGNNPAPVRNWGVCCAKCNGYVISVRIREARGMRIVGGKILDA